SQKRKPIPEPVRVQRIDPISPFVPPPVTDVLPAVTVFSRFAELSGSLALTALLASLAMVVWAAVRRAGAETLDWTELGSLYYKTVLVSWAVLIPAKCWTRRCRNGLARRLTMFCIGLMVGVATLWIDGWVIRPPLTATSTGAGLNSWLPSGRELTEAAGVLTYFAAA